MTNNTKYGIYLYYSSSGNLTGNILWNNGIMIVEGSISYWNTHYIDTSNLVNGKPVYYYKNQTGGEVPSDAGQVILANCRNMTVANLTLNNASVGILLGYSTNITITGNNIFNNSDSGIYLSRSDINYITNNTLYNNSDGIYISSSNNNNIGNNYITNNSNSGIYLYQSGAEIITGNIFLNDGIFIDGDSLTYWDTHSIDSTNLVNGRPVYYFKNQNGGAVPADGGQVILANSNNITVADLNVSNGSAGILIGFSNNNTLIRNNASGNSIDGIYLLYSDGNTIKDNIASANQLSGVMLSCSNNNNLTGNNASNSGAIGIRLYESEYNNIIENSVFNNSAYGIAMSYSSYNLIVYNRLYNNGKYGLIIYSSSRDNIVHHNYFINNNNGSCQAYDGSGGNEWNLTSPQEGNYWSNWNGQNWGTALAYPIDGSAGASDWYPMLLNMPPVASFTCNVTSGIAPLAVQFNSTSTDPDGSIASYFWDFGDGNTSSSRNTTHTYLYPGSYVVNLTVTDNNGAASYTTITINVTSPPSNIPPVASFTCNVTSGVAPLAVQFTSTSTDPDGSIQSYLWDFGDGNTSSLINPTHTYLNPGTYVVNLTVTDNQGATSYTTRTIDVTSPPSNTPPVASFTCNVTSGIAPLAVQFNSTSTDPDGSIESYQWDFGDGNTSSVQNPSHTYLYPGSYVVNLTVTDNDGATSYATVTVAVSQPGNLPRLQSRPKNCLTILWFISTQLQQILMELL